MTNVISLNLLLILGLAAEPRGEFQPHLERFEAIEPQMGVPFRVVVYAKDRPAATTAIDAAFARAARLNRILSDYDPASELSRLSQRSPTESSVRLSDDLWAVLVLSRKLSERTEGAFDVTVGPTTRLWRRARRQRKLPTDERIAQAKQSVGFQFLRLDEATQSAELLRANMRLDLGGIGKGYAADQMLGTLQELGIHRALVDASGDLSLGDPPPETEGWRIGIAPLEPEAPPSQYLLLANCGIATSGDAWQHVEIDGKRYSHIVDPKTGIGLTDHSSVTVVGPNGTLADAYASAISVLGPKCGMDLANRTPGISALVVRAPQGKVQVYRSHGFEKLTTAKSNE